MTQAERSYRYFDFVMAGFVTVLLCSNLIGPAKICIVAGIAFGTGNLFFPISYVFGDLLTEVYGYARARRVIWCGFAALLFASFMSWVVVSIPSAGGSPYQDELQKALALTFGNTFRIVLASIVAFWCGEFVNSFVLAKMKVWSGGKGMGVRFIASTAAGQGVDSLIFYPLAFYGIFTDQQLVTTMVANFVLKVGWEALLTPVTTRLARWLKRAEGEDYYDRKTDFSPFLLR
jgi:uncharacterized integral membrane protein (TIGR00697 family)